MKKAIITININWIFVLVVGGIILLFFVGISTRQKDVSDTVLSGMIKSELDGIITGAKVSTGTTNILDMPNVDIEFSCESYNIGTVSETLTSRVIFSPVLLKGRKLLTWAWPFSLPYKSENFLYLTTTDYRYILVYGSGQRDFAEHVNKTLPESLNKELIAKGQILSVNNLNNYKVRFVLFDVDEKDVIKNVLNDMPPEDITVVEVKGNDLIFYDRNINELGSTHYLDEASLFAAIFTDDYELYNCMMGKAMQRLSYITASYELRRESLEDFYFDNIRCGLYYDIPLNEYTNAIESCFDYENCYYGPLISMADVIRSDNQLLQRQSCPMIY